MVTRILIRIIVGLVLINVAMIMTVFAVYQPNEYMITYAAEDNGSCHDIECEFTSEPTFLISCETEDEYESPEVAMVVVNETETKIEAMQYPDDSLVVNLVYEQPLETEFLTDPPTEGGGGDSTEDDCSASVVYYNLTNEDRDMLLRIAMAEVGCEDCVDCLALVMRTVLNRVESPLFPNNIYKVIHAENQFSPVASGSFATAKPNDKCHEALDLVINGWDKSQGALYFEACAGSSWHSRNLELLFQHCSTRFYK